MYPEEGEDSTTVKLNCTIPVGSTGFYRPDGTPNVTIVTSGNLVVNGAGTLNGIVLVLDGGVILHGNAKVEGVLYVANPNETVLTGKGSGDAKVTGGIISHGNVSGTTTKINIRHSPDYMDAFCDDYQTESDNNRPKNIVWKYELD